MIQKLKENLEEFYQKEKQKENVVSIKLNKNIIINYSNIKNISLTNRIFKSLIENYNDFDKWYKKLQSNNIDIFYTEKNKEISSIMILKINEIDSQQFYEKGKILKIRTLVVEDRNKGIGTTYLNIVDEVAKINNIDYIYLTIKINNKALIEFVEKNGYKRYNLIDDEFVYYKELR